MVGKLLDSSSTEFQDKKNGRYNRLFRPYTHSLLAKSVKLFWPG